MTTTAHRMKRPAFQWYPGDARRDVALQACSLEARGLWREMMDLMHDGEPYGHLTAGDVTMTNEQLSRIVGVPLPKLRKLVSELELHKVFSRNAAGVIYSRRMVRDEHIRNVRASSGKLGGNPALLDKQRDNHPTNQTVKQKPTPAVAVAVASAVAVAVVKDGTGGTKYGADEQSTASASAGLTFADLPPAAVEFGKRYYATATPERRGEIAQQLLATLHAGAFLNRSAQAVKAGSLARLEAKCLEVLAAPPRDRDKAIVHLLKKLADTSDNSAPGHVVERAAKAERQDEERTSAKHVASAEAWLTTRPDVATTIEDTLDADDALDKDRTNPIRRIMRLASVLGAWRASGEQTPGVTDRVAQTIANEAVA